MAMIRSEHGLPTLRIFVAPRRERFAEALFQVVRGSDEPRDVARCGLSELGLPDTLAGLDPVDDNSLTIPQAVVETLQAAVDEIGLSPLPPENALWLEFPSPRGFLYIVPWERLLAPLGRTLFRLPNHLVRPQAADRKLQVAICISTPRAKERFFSPGKISALLSAYQHLDARVHVFTDQEWFQPVSGVCSHLPYEVEVHDPSSAFRYEAPERSTRVGSAPDISSPWLLWMRDEMNTTPLDFVHFVTHGYMSGPQGAIALAMSPTLNTDRGLSRFIGSVELHTFLTQVGAWGLILSGPPKNYSDVGLRELADGIALIRPGVAITHDWERDDDCGQLGRVMQSIVGTHAAGEAILPAITCWIHPRFVEFETQDHKELFLNDDGSSAFITDATRRALSDQHTETWVASVSRVMEAQQMRWLPDSTDTPPDKAAVTALRNVAALVEKHVARTYPPGEGGQQ